MSKRKTLAVVAAVAAFAAVSASAATLGGLNSASLGADTSVVASCDTDGVAVSYTTAYHAASKEYRVSAVDLSGIAGTCDTGTIKVTLASDSASLGETSGTVAGSTASLAISATAEDVTNVAVVIVK
jgi:hypothetical protein